jgi:hypothetical protein
MWVDGVRCAARARRHKAFECQMDGAVLDRRRLLVSDTLRTSWMTSRNAMTLMVSGLSRLSVTLSRAGNFLSSCMFVCVCFVCVCMRVHVKGGIKARMADQESCLPQPCITPQTHPLLSPSTARRSRVQVSALMRSWSCRSEGIVGGRACFCTCVNVFSISALAGWSHTHLFLCT